MFQSTLLGKRAQVASTQAFRLDRGGNHPIEVDLRRVAQNPNLLHRERDRQAVFRGDPDVSYPSTTFIFSLRLNRRFPRSATTDASTRSIRCPSRSLARSRNRTPSSSKRISRGSRRARATRRATTQACRAARCRSPSARASSTGRDVAMPAIAIRRVSFFPLFFYSFV